MKPHLLNIKTIIDKPIHKVFEFFSSAENLSKLTPKDFNFEILTPLPIVIKEGALIDYRIRLKGIAIHWQTEIALWEPPFRFIDIQKKGPFQIWKHEHRFEDLQGKTQMTDTVEYLSPGWILEPFINSMYVRNKVNQIFDYRSKQIQNWVKNSI